jgi:3-oxoacyl-[acyl-carrier protein] reductase
VQRKGHVALITGTSRTRGVGAGVAKRLAGDGWDIGLTWWLPADHDMPWAGSPDEPFQLVETLREAGVRVAWHEADLVDVSTPREIFEAVEAELGPITALVNSHAVSVGGGIFDTTVEDFDQHMAVNARATLLLIREFARRLPAEMPGRVVNLTSDAVYGEVAYGASKGALERITVAAARELAPRGITVNAVNPGPNDTGWMTARVRRRVLQDMPMGRLGRPSDTAALVSFLCSDDGAWITGQVLFSDGGFGGRSGPSSA